MKYEIRDINLAPSGHQKIQWVRNNMPLLRGLEEEFLQTKPFEGIKISLSVHLEAKTAYLCKVLAAGGAQMSVTGSNILSTQDDVAASLADDGAQVVDKHIVFIVVFLAGLFHDATDFSSYSFHSLVQHQGVCYHLSIAEILRTFISFGK